MMDAQWTRRSRVGPAAAAMMAAAVVATGCATPQGGATPNRAPDWKPPNVEAHAGWCYAVQAEAWPPTAFDRFPELEGFSMPTVVYLGLETEHGAMNSGVHTGNEELAWENAREARWIGEKPLRREPRAFDHAHWWQMDDGSYRIGFAGSYLFWVGFEVRPTDDGLGDGLEGVLRYWSRDALGEAGELEVSVNVLLEHMPCSDTPVVRAE